MTTPPRKLFLEEGGYRHRRLIDAARFLPFLGAFLFLTPALLIPAGDGGGLAIQVIFYFLAWAGLIAMTAAVSRALGRRTRDEEAD